jgi:hypothetical protein
VHSCTITTLDAGRRVFFFFLRPRAISVARVALEGGSAYSPEGPGRHLFRRSIRTTRVPHAALAARRGIFVQRRFPACGSYSSRCRSRLWMSRFFAVAALATRVVGRSSRVISAGRPTHAGLYGRPLSLTADPLRPSAGGAKPDVVTSDTLCRPVGAIAGSPLARVRRRFPVFRQDIGTPRRQDSERRRPVRGNAITEPRVPSAGSISTSRSSEALRVPCYVRAKVLAPFCPKRSGPSRRDEWPPRATPYNLGLPRGSPRRHGEDASCRPLQPTHDTSTRESLDFRVRSSRCADCRILRQPEGSASPVQRQTTLRQSNPGWARA